MAYGIWPMDASGASFQTHGPMGMGVGVRVRGKGQKVLEKGMSVEEETSYFLTFRPLSPGSLQSWLDSAPRTPSTSQILSELPPGALSGRAGCTS